MNQNHNKALIAICVYQTDKTFLLGILVSLFLFILRTVTVLKNVNLRHQIVVNLAVI